MVGAQIELLSRSFLFLMGGMLLRSTTMAAICVLPGMLLRSKSAAIRHSLWNGVLYAMLFIPVLQLVIPRPRHFVKAVTAIESAIVPARPVSAPAPVLVTNIQLKLPREQGWHRWLLALPALYFVITCIALSRLTLGLAGLSKIVSASEYIADPDLRELVYEIWLLSGARWKPRIRLSRHLHVPVASDLSETVILLPASWTQWDAASLRAVLVHEMAHLERRDPLNGVVASLCTCLFWFHPLAWFLKSHLALLAEEACDEAAVEMMEDRASYARLLIDFAREVSTRQGRVLTGASAAMRGVAVKSRIERILNFSAAHKKGAALIRSLLIAGFLPLVYLASAPGDRTQSAGESALDLQTPKTSAEAAELELTLRGNPEDLNARERLLLYYLDQKQTNDYRRHLSWISEYHPESRILNWAAIYSGLTPEDVSTAQSTWAANIARNPASPDVLFHAGLSFTFGDPMRAVQLLQQARGLEQSGSNRSVYALNTIYTAAFLPGMTLSSPFDQQGHRIPLTAEAAATLRSQLQASTDPELLSEVGGHLVRLASAQHSHEQTETGLELLRRAVSLDPQNQKWSDALDSAMLETVRRQNERALAQDAQSHSETGAAQESKAVRISSKVAAQNLVTKIDPKYPPLALHAGVQGTVQFTIRIAPDGHVQDIRLVSGHPLLADAALKAVNHWIYRPTLLNGQAVSVIADVSIPFVLPQ